MASKNPTTKLPASFKRKLLLSVAGAAALVGAALMIPGVEKGPDPEKVAVIKEQVKTLTEASIKQNTSRITVGSVMSPKTVYVFFDPRCPHCNHLWNAMEQANLSGVKFEWVPIGILGAQSIAQSAMLISANEVGKGVDALKQHEATFGAGGIKVENNEVRRFKDQVMKNSEYITAFATSVPYVVMFDANGKPKINEGSMTPEQLKTFVGQ